MKRPDFKSMALSELNYFINDYGAAFTLTAKAEEWLNEAVEERKSRMTLKQEHANMTLEQEHAFKEKCKSELPEFVKSSDKIYRMNAHGLMSNGYRIIYGEWEADNGFYNWDTKLIDMIYDAIDFSEIEFITIINDFKDRLNACIYEVISESDLVRYTDDKAVQSLAECIADEHFTMYGTKAVEPIVEPEVVMTLKDFVSKYASSVTLQASLDYPISRDLDGTISIKQKAVQKTMFDKIGALQFIVESVNIEDEMESMELGGILSEIIMSPFTVFTLDYILGQLKNFDLK